MHRTLPGLEKNQTWGTPAFSHCSYVNLCGLGGKVKLAAPGAELLAAGG